MQFPAKRWIRPVAPKAGAGGDLLAALLESRGIVGREARDAYFGPSLRQLQAPWDMHGVEEAARALAAAVRSGRRIAIYGDYDVDGVMATAILWHALRAIRPDLPVRTYVPHRRKEGYGLNADAIERLADEGIELIVTVDCGVSAVDEAELVRARSIELVITDHHNLRADGTVPVARAVVHPRLPSGQRFGDLCGAAVAWKLAWALFYEVAGCSREGVLPKGFRESLLGLLPLAAVGTIADVMPLVDENRAIVAVGLPRLHATGITGFDRLLARTRLGPGAMEASAIDAGAIAFRLAPWINACGRMQHAEDAVELLTTATGSRADELVKLLEGLNDRRKIDGDAIHKEARDQWLARCEAEREERRQRKAAQGPLASKVPDRSSLAIVLEDDRWNLGIVGIVCSKLVEEFARPTILLTRDVHEGSGIFKGSGRSVPGLDMHAALARCADTLVSFGGHAMAAGVKVHESRIDGFRKRFAQVVEEMWAVEGEPRTELAIDAVLGLDAFTIGAVQQLDRMQPFGRGNPRPMVLVEDVEVTQVRPLGRDGKHLEVVVREVVAGQKRFLRMQWWRAAQHAKAIGPGARIDVVFEPGFSVFRGNAEVSATIADLSVRAPAASSQKLEVAR